MLQGLNDGPLLGAPFVQMVSLGFFLGKQQLIRSPVSETDMTAADRFMKKISDYYNDLGYPVVWEDVGSERQLEMIQIESGYFVTATLLAEGNDVIVKDEWGRAQKIKATKGNLEMIKSWSE